MTCIIMGKYYIKTGVNVKNGIFQLLSASRRSAFETSIRQMVAPFCIFCKCAGYLQIVYRRGDRLTPGAVLPPPRLPYPLLMAVLITALRCLQLSDVFHMLVLDVFRV